MLHGVVFQDSSVNIRPASGKDNLYFQSKPIGNHWYQCTTQGKTEFNQREIIKLGQQVRVAW